MLQMLEQCVRKMLMNEKDTDVMSAMQKAVEELDRTQVQMESVIIINNRLSVTVSYIASQWITIDEDIRRPDI